MILDLDAVLHNIHHKFHSQQVFRTFMTLISDTMRFRNRKISTSKLKSKVSDTEETLNIETDIESETNEIETGSLRCKMDILLKESRNLPIFHSTFSRKFFIQKQIFYKVFSLKQLPFWGDVREEDPFIILDDGSIQHLI